MRWKTGDLYNNKYTNEKAKNHRTKTCGMPDMQRERVYYARNPVLIQLVIS